MATTNVTPTPSTGTTTNSNQLTPTSTEAKVVTVVAALVGAITAVHPGWTSPTWLTAVETGVSWIIAGGVYLVHFFTARKATAAK